MRKPLVSIITVVFNNVEGIEKTILNVTQQTYQHIEYIIIDGGSTDGTVNLIRKHSPAIQKFVSEPDKGIYDAMNKGILLAEGELIGIINSGDFYELNSVQHVVETYLANPNFDVYHGMLRVFSIKKKFLYVIGNDSSFLQKGMIEHPTCFVKKEVYDSDGLFDPAYKSSSDYDFMLKLRKNERKFYFIEFVISNFYEGGISSNTAAILETLTIRQKYRLISNAKKRLITAYIKLKAIQRK